MKTLPVVLLLSGISSLVGHVQSRHFETADTIIIEGLKLDQHNEQPLLEGQKKFPHLASLMRDGKVICAGALIDNLHVLTTANCMPNITSEDVSSFQVGIGYQSFNHDIPDNLKASEGPYYLRRVTKVIMDRSFYYQSLMTVRNSLAILKLDAPLTNNDSVEPAILADEATFAKYRNTPLKTGKLCGWRKSKDTNGKEMTFLLGVSLRIYSYEECRKEYLNSKKMDDVICATSAGSNPCYFELGSPLTIRRNGRNILLGIRERDCHFPNIFTRVEYFLPWIRKNLVY